MCCPVPSYTACPIQEHHVATISTESGLGMHHSENSRHDPQHCCGEPERHFQTRNGICGRVTKIDGLHLLDCDTSNIYLDPTLHNALQTMNVLDIPPTIMPLPQLLWSSTTSSLCEHIITMTWCQHMTSGTQTSLLSVKHA